MPGEVVRLWRSLVKDYVTDLTMLLEPHFDEQARAVLRISVCSQRYDDHRPAGYTYCWAYRDFLSVGYSINPAQLFDLLIVARESIVHVLAHPDNEARQPIQGK